MLDKHEIASALRETGLLLKAKGENAFKAKAYISAARTIERVSLDVGTLIESQCLTELPGIGESLANYITDLYSTGEAKLLNKLREELPPGTAELSQVDGLTLKRIKALNEQLNITSIEQLADACLEGKVATLKGFGVKVQNDILQSIQALENSETDKLRLINAMDVADGLVANLRAAAGDRVEPAGQMRRWHEEIDRLTIVAQGDAKDIARSLTKAYGSQAVEEKDGAVLVHSAQGYSAEILPVDNFALGLIAHTGTPHHFEQLKELAERKGFHLTSSHLKKGTREIACKTEESVFKALGLQFIPPELREGVGEVEEAEIRGFDDLITEDDIRGMTHCHTTFSDGKHTVEEMVTEAERMGMDYITITDHSPTAHYAGGLDIDTLKRQWEEIARVQESHKIKILRGTECDILSDGKLDYPDHILEQFDIVIASIHSRYKQNEEQMTKRLMEGLRNPHFKVWGHPLGRLVLKRDPIPCNVPKLLEAVADANVAIEINGDPYRLDLAPQWAKIAKEVGLKFVVSTDAHSTDNLYNLMFGIRMARRARLTPKDVLNTLPVEKFKQAVRVKQLIKH